MKEEIIMKPKECSSLSGLSTLTYKIGCKDDKEVCLSIVGNTGKGVFNKDWVSLKEIDSMLTSEKKPITSKSLHGLFEGKSSNSAGFILAVLLNEGLLKVSSKNQRNYDRVDKKEYQKIIKAYTKKKTGKKAREVS
jgi:predicted HTH transcriptional regulator